MDEIIDLVSSDTDCEINDNPNLTQAPRFTNTCALCETAGLIKKMAHCSDCKVYFHGKCAAEYGDETVCWVCDLDSIIGEDEDDTPEHQEVMGMFDTLHPPDDDMLDECEEEEIEDIEPDESTDSIPTLTSETKSMRRWKEFLENATAKFDKNFEEITTRIKQELQDEEKKGIYSLGFAQDS